MPSLDPLASTQTGDVRVASGKAQVSECLRAGVATLPVSVHVVSGGGLKAVGRRWLAGYGRAASCSISLLGPDTIMMWCRPTLVSGSAWVKSSPGALTPTTVTP